MKASETELSTLKEHIGLVQEGVTEKDAIENVLDSVHCASDNWGKFFFMVTCLGWLVVPEVRDVLRMLLQKEEAEFADLIRHLNTHNLAFAFYFRH